MRPEEDQDSLHYRQRSQTSPNRLYRESRPDAVHPACPSHQEGAGSIDHRVQRKNAHSVLSVVAGRRAGDLYDVLGRVE